MSASNVSILRLSVPLTGTVASYRFVTHAGTQAAVASNAIGVTCYGGVSGEIVPVDVLGTAIVEAGAAVAKGAAIQSDATGRGITQTSTNPTLARAREAATAAGQLIEVLLIPN